jgi:hypothetical protein
MKSDIVSRLLERTDGKSTVELEQLTGEAAEEIQRLRAVLKEVLLDREEKETTCRRLRLFRRDLL